MQQCYDNIFIQDEKKEEKKEEEKEKEKKPKTIKENLKSETKTMDLNDPGLEQVKASKKLWVLIEY